MKGLKLIKKFFLCFLFFCWKSFFCSVVVRAHRLVEMMENKATNLHAITITKVNNVPCKSVAERNGIANDDDEHFTVDDDRFIQLTQSFICVLVAPILFYFFAFVDLPNHRKQPHSMFYPVENVSFYAEQWLHSHWACYCQFYNFTSLLHWWYLHRCEHMLDLECRGWSVYRIQLKTSDFFFVLVLC